MLLSSPKVAQLLAKSRNPSAAKKGLEKIAAAEPAIAAEVLGLNKAVSDAFTVETIKLAAEPETGQNAGSSTAEVEMQ